MELLKYELDQLKKGNTLIAGVDEAGRGPLAGPIVIAIPSISFIFLH